MPTSLTWPSVFKLNTDWNDSPKTWIVKGKPEVGPPISRARSHNIEHNITASVDMSYTEYTTVFVPFVQSTMGGVKPFRFTSPIDSLTYDTYFGGDNNPYTIKRRDDYLYTVSFVLVYRQLGAF